jgi:hypothetical protein
MIILVHDKYRVASQKPQKENIDKFRKALINGSVSRANRYAAKLIMSGKYNDLWHTILDIYATQIHLLNHNLVQNISDCYHYLNRIKNKASKHKVHIGNIQEIRNRISELVTRICLEKKQPIQIPDQIQVLDIPKKDYSCLITKKYIDQYGLDKSIRIPISQFIYTYQRVHHLNYLHWINHILLLNRNAEIQTTNLKVPKALSKHPIYLLWNYIIFKSPDQIHDYLGKILDLFNIALSKKRYQVCCCLFFMACCISQLNKLDLSENRDLNPVLIKAIMNVNAYY